MSEAAQVVVFTWPKASVTLTKDGPDSSGESCRCCHKVDDRPVFTFTERGPRIRDKSVPVHESCAPDFFCLPGSDRHQREQRRREIEDNTVPPGYTAEQHAQFQREREQNIAEWKAEWDKYNRGERSTEPGRPAHSQQLMEWWHARADAANAAKDMAKGGTVTDNVVPFSNQQSQTELERQQRERIEIPRIAAQMKIDGGAARLVYRHRAGYVLTDDETLFVKALEKGWAKQRAESALGIARPNGAAVEASEVIVKSKREFKLTPFEQIKFNPENPHVADGLIPKNGLAIVLGPPKCGKSFWVFDLGMHVALGWPYRGRAVEQGTVVYCAAEGGNGFNNRVVAWRQRFRPDSEDRAPVPFYLLATPLDLITDHPALLAAIKAQAGGVPTIVVIDTLNRTLVGSENRPEDMAKFIRAADVIRVAFGCAVIIIHHCGIDGSRPRGHSSLAGADDVQIAVSKDSSGLIRIEVEHMKDGEPTPPFACRLESVEVGIRKDGRPGTSMVVVDAELPPTPAGKRPRVNDNQQRFLDILADAILDAPDQEKTTGGIPGGRTAITREWLRECCVEKGWLDEADTATRNRLQVNNMINKLTGKRLIGSNKTYVWDAR